MTFDAETIGKLGPGYDPRCVQPVGWLGTCPKCHLPSPEVRDTPEQAQQDVDDCPCNYPDTQEKEV